MICKRCGEVTETFMTKGMENCAKPASGPCRKSRSPIRLDGLGGWRNLEMSPSMVSNGLGKRPQIRRRAGMVGNA
ncbi:hypothetical protein DNFV4_04597 [Nitrospira tepida]|uniref:Uncharacterized protein n=1 Tax=Nitrospira tepida TaxID=2973512 RepID=A0AA86N3J9_9BACT|nr:hypothetical protein DNFV4_04597 [Nitrospira tepida]